MSPDEIVWLDSPPRPAVVSDDEWLAALDSPPPRGSECVRGESAPSIPGIPRKGITDDFKRFSFGLSNLGSRPGGSEKKRSPRRSPKKKAAGGGTRLSFSQPITVADEFTEPATASASSTTQLPTARGAAAKKRGGRGETAANSAISRKDSDCTASTLATSPQKTEKGKGRAKKELQVEDEFFGVYCLISRSPLKHYKVAIPSRAIRNRCYIGYTVDPNRRIRQHNGGKECGGAKKTDNRGPWDMVCIVHGFPNSVSALRFEWAWQNPEKSRVIKEHQLKKTMKETPFAFRLRIACHLIQSEPWRRLALTFRWLIQSEQIPFPVDVLPPSHIGTAYGLVEKKMTRVRSGLNEMRERGPCALCYFSIDNLRELLRCPSSSCFAHFHMRCLASNGLSAKQEQSSALFPINGACPTCKSPYLWGDMVRDQRAILKADAAQPDEGLKGLVPFKTTPSS